MSYGTLDVVVGGLYGSLAEAKGHTVQRLAESRIAEGHALDVVRVAGPNAGHTGHDKDGRPWAFRQLPVAAVVPGPCVLAIADGSEIDSAVLIDELVRAQRSGLLDGKIVKVSLEATMIADGHKTAESNQNLTDRIGSTGKGIGAARASRLMRTAKRLADDPRTQGVLRGFGVQLVPTYQPAPGHSVIVEGTQGYALGLHAGYYPQCTSSDCRAVDFLSMAGINPWGYRQFEVWVVARTYPIRVAGNSGPMEGETSWESLGLAPEKTTVTQKIRRVGAPDWDLVAEAIYANGPTHVNLALMMADQMWPEVTGLTEMSQVPTPIMQAWADIADQVRAPLRMIGTGPNSVIRVGQ